LFTGLKFLKPLPIPKYVMSDQSKIGRRPTYEELVAENAHLREENTSLRKRVTELETVVKDLRIQVEESTTTRRAGGLKSL
jgi:regulator of replication initiation timing